MVKKKVANKGKAGFRRILQWFMPGLGVKRWFGVLLAGITLSGLGLAIFVIDLYRNFPESDLLPVVAFLSLRFLPRLARVLIFGLLGVGLILLGLWGINRSLLVPFLRPGKRLVDQVTEFRKRGRGPRVVVIGGGHGIATVLRGLKEYSNNLTAVVSVADDGGSSGELRRSLGIPPPGDIRNCLAALSDDEDLLTQLFQYRFGEDTGLGGHSFGNLFISALVDITGSFEEAVSESGRALSVHGRVLPSTLHNVRLVADVQIPQATSEMRVEGESQIPKTVGRVRRVWLEPNDAPAFPAVIQAILSADLIIVGPGSLYTSILPNLLVNDVLEAVRASRGLKVFVVNLINQGGETEGYNASDHIHTIQEVIGADIFNIVVCNSWYDIKFGKDKRWVQVDPEMMRDARLYQADLADHDDPIHHDAEKLGKALMDLFFERTGPLG